jgi:hypothetical protein
MPFTTLTDDEAREFYRLHRFYWREARRCEEAKAYLAGCVMLGSALETMLLLMVDAHENVAVETGQAPMRKGQIKPLLDWNFAELLRVAKAANWLPSVLDPGANWSTRKARIGDYAEVVRMLRNLAHPSRYAIDHARSRVTPKFLQRQFQVVLACRDWLVHHNNQSLIEHMKAKGTRP